MDKHYVYIARCKDNTYYTGYTIDLKKRQGKHNKGDGARYTKYRRPVKIVYSEEFASKEEAMSREYEIKGFTRADKEKLIKIKPS